MDLWNAVCKTDPAAVKPITGKQYQGNSPKPYWLIEQATKAFGPVGIGWGVEVKSERFERLGEFDVLHVAVVSVWYMKDGVRSQTFDQMGGTKAAYKTAKGSLMVDEDAGKKSVTDGMVKCLSMIGFAGDIFSGRWDDSKYVESLRREFGNESGLEKALKASVDAVQHKGVISASKLAYDALTAEQRAAAHKAAPHIEAAIPDVHKALNILAMALEEWHEDDRQDFKAGLWHLLGSATRSAMKKQHEANQQKETATS